MNETLTPAEALKLNRERAGLTQFEAQVKLGVLKANFLSQVENGKRIPDARLARKIEALFHVPAESWRAQSAA